MPPTAPLDVFFDEVLRTNPFETNRVVPAQSAWVDAEDIFADVFRQLLERVELAHRERLAQGILLWGEAGIGKSHLLARLERRLCADPPQALFVALANLQAEPERMPRALLRSVMGVLTAGRAERWRGTPLWRAVNGMLRTALGGDTGRVYGIPEAEQAYQRLVDTLCRETPGRAAVLDRTVFDVLLRFIIGALDRTGRQNDSADLAVRWLRGDWLDAEDAERLGVPMTADGGGIADDEQVKKTLVALAQVALLWGRPMVLVLDQVDNLEPAQFKALTRFLHALLDAASNLVVITAGVQATLVQWRQEKVVQDSSWDRLAQFTVELQRLPLAAAAPLVTVRLDDFCKPFAGMEEVTGRRRDPFSARRGLVRAGGAWPVGPEAARHAQSRRGGWQELRTAPRARQAPSVPRTCFPLSALEPRLTSRRPRTKGRSNARSSRRCGAASTSCGSAKRPPSRRAAGTRRVWPMFSRP
ncbi:MAG: ATP-binding protein [Gemmataceae bacterium]